MIDAPLTAVSFAPLAVALPIFGAALAFILRRKRRTQRTVTIGILVITLCLEAWMLATVWDGGTYSVTLGGWAPPFGISMVVDGFSAFMLVVSSIVSLAVLLYATSQGMADGDEDGPVSIFHPAYLILVAGVSNAFLAGDLFNLYVGFEILLTASYVLLTLGGTTARIRAGTTYVVVSVASSLLFLIAIGMIYAAVGTVNMADLAVKLPEISPGHPDGAARDAAGGLRHQGGRLPAVLLAARLLPDGPGPGHRGVRRAADQGRRLRDHPHRDAAVPREPALRPADGRGGADHAGGNPGCRGADRHQAHALLHADQPHRLPDLRRRRGQPAGTGRHHLLRGPPHRGADLAVPGRRAHRAPGRDLEHRPARFPGQALPAAGDCSSSSRP